jgi:putative membrane protein
MPPQPTWLIILPSCNAALNATSAVCLALAYGAIRCRRVHLHRNLMFAALTASTLFLVGYLTRMALTGTHRFPGGGMVKTCYLVLLFSHMVLAVVLLPLVLRALQLAMTGRFSAHRRIARWAWPIWMYVSVTGVVVYWMLYHLAPRLQQSALAALAP